MTTSMILELAEIDSIRKATRKISDTLDWIGEFIVEGVKTESLKKFCYEYLAQVTGFDPYRVDHTNRPMASISISHNYIVTGGQPGQLRLQQGDIVNIDLKIVVNHWEIESSRMYLLGKLPPKKVALVETAYDAMCAGINMIHPGATLGDIGHAVYSAISESGHHTVTNDVDQGDTPYHHRFLTISPIGIPGQGDVLQPGMVFILEPIVIARFSDIALSRDGHRVATSDCSPSAHWKQMIAVTAEGCEVLTQPHFMSNGLYRACLKASQETPWMTVQRAS